MSRTSAIAPASRSTSTHARKPRAAHAPRHPRGHAQGRLVLPRRRRPQGLEGDGPHFLGHTISHLQLDPRDGRTLLAAAKTGHLGPTIFRSTNLGRTWKEARNRRPSPSPHRRPARRARSTTPSG
jgi:hypothetical protein